MTLLVDRPIPSDPGTLQDDVQPWRGARLLGVAAAASLGAGAIHAAAIAAHSEHPQAVWAFFGAAIVQLVWGAVALARPRRWVTILGVVSGGAFLAAWIVAKKQGISFIDGLDDVEPVEFSDGFAAALAFVTLAAAGTALAVRRSLGPRLVAVAAGIAIVAGTVPATGAVVAESHHAATAATAATAEQATAEPAAAVPPRPFDPALPIDLGGVPGVTPRQQARAENLLAETVVRLPQWSDPAIAEAKGFQTIGDGVTGVEHYVNRTYIDDDTILDPDKPESLVYDTTTTPKTLVAAMYMLTPGSTLDTAPDIGGALTQWHIHNNLCFTAQGAVAGLTQADGTCAAPLLKGPETPMIHVWIVPRPCGPFSALEGIGGGQIKPGETVACDHAHGS